MNVGRMGFLCAVLVLLAGCKTAPPISLEHFSEGYGLAPPIPKSGGAGPPLFQPAFDLPVEDFTIPARLPELLTVYRQHLIAMAHPLPEGHAEKYADTVIESLKRRYAENDEALRAELIRRLRYTVVHPGAPADANQIGPLYPYDEQDVQSDQRGAQ
jgi:hypothetical protein